MPEHYQSVLLPHRREPHPKTLYLLSVVELFERAAGIAMLALFTLYLRFHVGYRESQVLLISGAFWGLSYLAGLPGGYLADRLRQPGGVALAGAVALTIGYAGLSIDSSYLLWPALGLLLVGHGLVKPNITTLIGRLYRGDDARRDAGFMVVYFFVNVGGLAGPLIAEWLRARWTWSAVFGAMTIMMGGGSLLMVKGWRRNAREADGAVAHPGHVPAPCTYRDRIKALLLLSAVGVVFWLAMQQASGSLVLFAQEHTIQRLFVGSWPINLRPGYFTALHGLLVLVLMPIMALRARRQRAQGREPSTPVKMLWGFVLMSAAFALMSLAAQQGRDAGRVSPLWLLACYVLMTPGELWLSVLGLSLVTQLAPPPMASRMAGLWFGSVAVGHWLGGALGLVWTNWSHHRYFAIVALLSLGAAVALFSRLGWLEGVLRTAAASSTSSSTTESRGG